MIDISERFWRSRIGEIWKQGYPSKGVIHIGANDGYEVQWYKALGINNIICFEPLKSAFDIFKDKYPDVKIYNVALGDKNETRKLNIATGDGCGSTLLKSKTGEKYVGAVKVKVATYDDFIEKEKIDISLFDALVIDVQGFEMQVLLGMGKYINNFNRINIEVSKTPQYEGEASGEEILKYLQARGFRALNEVPKKPHLHIHSDLLLVKDDNEN